MGEQASKRAKRAQEAWEAWAEADKIAAWRVKEAEVATQKAREAWKLVNNLQ